MDETGLTDMEKDALIETANIGAGNASAALSMKVEKKINITVSDIDFIGVNEIEETLEAPDKVAVGVYTPIIEGLSGAVVLLFEFLCYFLPCSPTVA